PDHRPADDQHRALRGPDSDGGRPDPAGRPVRGGRRGRRRRLGCRARDRRHRLLRRGGVGRIAAGPLHRLRPIDAAPRPRYERRQMRALYRLLTRWWTAFALAASLALLGAAHAFERFGGLAPCNLCLKQREVYWGAVAIALVATI